MISVVRWTASLWTSSAWYPKRPLLCLSTKTKRIAVLNFFRPPSTFLTLLNKWDTEWSPLGPLLPELINSPNVNSYGPYIDRPQKWSVSKGTLIKCYDKVPTYFFRMSKTNQTSNVKNFKLSSLPLKLMPPKTPFVLTRLEPDQLFLRV